MLCSQNGIGDPCRIHEQHMEAALSRARRPTYLRLIALCLAQRPERLGILAIDLTFCNQLTQFLYIALVIERLEDSNGGEITRESSIRYVADAKRDRPFLPE